MRQQTDRTHIYRFEGELAQPSRYGARQPQMPPLADTRLAGLAQKVAQFMHDRGQDSLFGYFSDWNVRRTSAVGVDGAVYLRAGQDDDGGLTGKLTDHSILSANEPEGSLREHWQNRFCNMLSRHYDFLEQAPSPARRVQDTHYRAACGMVDQRIAALKREARHQDITLTLPQNEWDAIAQLANGCCRTPADMVEAWLWHGVRLRLLMAHRLYERSFTIPWRDCYFRHPGFALQVGQSYPPGLHHTRSADSSCRPLILSLPAALVQVAAALPYYPYEDGRLEHGVALEHLLWHGFNDHDAWFWQERFAHSEQSRGQQF